MSRNSSKQAQAKGGFTLVELVVVIAVLAILAGVGAVAYNGYIEYAKKGVDRKTVGEIMHAVELADYADPNLFGESGGAMVVLSKNGIKAAGGTVGSDIDGALKDAFGELTSATLNYEKWDGAPDMGLFDKLPATGNINDYVSSLDGNNATQYAGHVEEIWNIVTMLVNGLNGNVELSGDMGIDFGGYTPQFDYLDKIVTRTMDADKASILEAWKSGNAFELYEDPTNKTGARQTAVELGATLARNYAFYQYAKSHPKYNEATMGEALEKLKIQGGYDYMATLTGGGAAEKVTAEGWSDIVNDYKDVAERDAKAYLAMMEAASTVKGEGTLEDEEYLKAVSSYTGMLDNVLSGAVNFDAIKTLATEATGNVIVVSATKVNGTLKFNVSPEEASPRDVEEEENYILTPTINFINDATGSFAFSSSRIDLSLSTCPECTIVFPSGSTANIIGSQTFDPDGFASFIKDATNAKIVAVSEGTTTLTLTNNNKKKPLTFTITVVVHP